MSAEHKRPLFAFVMVTILCAVMLGHAIRSDALGVLFASSPDRVTAQAPAPAAPERGAAGTTRPAIPSGREPVPLTSTPQDALTAGSTAAPPAPAATSRPTAVPTPGAETLEAVAMTGTTTVVTTGQPTGDHPPVGLTEDTITADPDVPLPTEDADSAAEEAAEEAAKAAQRAAEEATKAAEQAAEQAVALAAREAAKAAQDAARDAEKAARDAEKAARDAEKAARDAERAAERAAKDAEKAAKDAADDAAKGPRRDGPVVTAATFGVTDPGSAEED